MSTKEVSLGKIRPAWTADNSAILVAPNFKVGMEAHNSIPPPPPTSLNDLLGAAFTLTFLCICFNYSINNYGVGSVVLEEATVKKETESVPETLCIIFQYLGWKSPRNLRAQILSALQEFLAYYGNRKFSNLFKWCRHSWPSCARWNPVNVLAPGFCVSSYWCSLCNESIQPLEFAQYFIECWC
jgi:hypothetical protein